MKYKKDFEILQDNNYSGPFDEDTLEFFRVQSLYRYIFARPSVGMVLDPDNYKNYMLYGRLRFKKNAMDLQIITRALLDASIDYRLIKGIGIAMCYPEPFTRTMGDHDILVQPADHYKACEVLKSLGYTEGPKTDHDIAFMKSDMMMVELHFGLLNEVREPYTLTLMDEIWKNPVDLTVNNSVIKIPNEFWHFRYIVLHMMKHLKYKGFGIRYLVDLVHFSNVNHIDLLSHIDFFESIGYGQFYKGLLIICKEELNLDVKEEPWMASFDRECIDWLKKYIAESGTFGSATEDRKIEDLYENFSGSKDWSNFTSKWLFVFPKPDMLSNVYSYAKNYKFLLPIAWIHRLFRLVLRKDMKSSQKLFFVTKNSASLNQKEKMMKYLGLWK